MFDVTKSCFKHSVPELGRRQDRHSGLRVTLSGYNKLQAEPCATVTARPYRRLPLSDKERTRTTRSVVPCHFAALPAPPPRIRVRIEAHPTVTRSPTGAQSRLRVIQDSLASIPVCRHTMQDIRVKVRLAMARLDRRMNGRASPMNCLQRSSRLPWGALGLCRWDRNRPNSTKGPPGPFTERLT